jgi:tetratricopeptide (TPR) repeat protein
MMLLKSNALVSGKEAQAIEACLMATGQTTAFGALLRRYRMLAGLTQEQLAERAGLSARAITALERGVNRSPHRETFRLLADALALGAEERSALEAASRGRRGSANAYDDVASQATQVTRPPLVGRAREMARLPQHLEGRGPPLLLLCGEPGIGKSRLIQEAATLASARGMTILEGGCHWNTCQEPYAPVITAIERHLARESLAQRRADLRGCAWLARMLPELEEVVGQPTSSYPLTPEQERRLTFTAVVRFFTNIAGPGGVLLLVDDLQWIGPDVHDLLAHLVRSASGIGLRLIAAYRDTDVYLPLPLATNIITMVRNGEAARLELAPLATSEAENLLARLMEDAPDDNQQVKALILTRAEGVPFYLVSCAQALRSGAIVEEAAEEVPWDIAASVRQRLALLPEVAQELVDVAAVVGQEASGTLLARASGLSTHETVAALNTARRARLLIEDDMGIYRFSHDVIWEVVVADMGTTRRQLLHRQIAEALEQENRVQWLDALVYHYARSDEREKALPYLERAAHRAMEQRAHGTAEIFYWQQLELLNSLGRELEAARVYEHLGILLRIVARHDEALDSLTHAAETYRAAGDIESLTRVTAQIGWVHARRGTPGDGLVALRALLATLNATSLSSRELADLHIALGELEFVSCHYATQLRTVEQAAEYARDANDVTLLAKAEMRRGMSLFSLGYTDESQQVLDAALALAEQSRDSWTLCRTQNGLGILYRARGQFEEARLWTERACDVAEQQGDPTAISFMWYDLGETDFYQGDWQKARTAFERAAALMRELPPSWISTYALLGLGRVNLAEGNFEAAQRDLDDAIARSHQINELQVLRFAHNILAERDIVEGRPAQALARLEPLLDRDEQREIYVTMLLPVLAWSCHNLGDVARAEAIAAQSIERARTQRYHLALVDALRVVAIIAMGQQRWAQAQASLDEVLDLSRTMPYPYAEAKSRHVAGQLHLARSEPEQARAQFDAALAICAQLGERLYAAHIERAICAIDER